MDKVIIDFRNGLVYEKNYIIDFKNKVIYDDNSKRKIDDDFYDKFVSLIYKWKDEYNSNRNIIDDEEFNIEIYNNNVLVQTYHGLGNYPYNYKEFKELLGDQYE